MKEFILLFLFLSVFTYIHGNRYCVDFLVYDSIEDKSKFDLKAKCYFIQPVDRKRTCHNINLDCSFVPFSTHPRSSQIRPLTETEIVPGYWWWDEDEYRPRHVRSHYVDVYTLPNCKGTRTALNKVENRLFTTFQLLSQNNLICYTYEIQSLIIYPRDLPREGLPLDYYNKKKKKNSKTPPRNQGLVTPLPRTCAYGPKK
uniref:Uncharacterized protein n=1 Tax=Cacopsylla melanoneura TaxID=428564 RepID=A0A8D8RT85_9HEMI